MRDKFIVDSWKKANKSALSQAFLSALFCVVYTYIVMFFTGGEEFVGKYSTLDVINGIRHDVVLIVCGILAALIPIMLLRCTKIKYLCLYLPMSILYYIAIMLFCILLVIDDNFDLITYALVPIPIGSFIGTAASGVVSICSFNHSH